MSTRAEVMALRRLGSLNYRRAERLKERRDPQSVVFRARSIEFYTAASALITGHRAEVTL